MEKTNRPVWPEAQRRFYTPRAFEIEKTEDYLNPALILAFFLLHIPLFLLAKQSQLISRFYSLVPLFLGLLWLASDSKPTRVWCAVAYITAGEILWRGTNGAIFWEYGKYATSLLMLLALLKYRSDIKPDPKPVFFFLLLLPSLAVLPSFNRQTIAFQMAGPFALAVATFLFSRIQINRSEFKKILLAFISPLIGLAFTASYQIATSDYLALTGVSSYATSADIGPNQVSTAFGLGALAAFLFVFIERRQLSLRFLCLGVALWLILQSMLTFSRGGFWSTILALVIAGFFFLGDRRSRAILLLAGSSSLLVGYFILFPVLDHFTGGLLTKRFRDFDTTHRIEIMQSDINLFKEHLLFGVGPGQSPSLRRAFGIKGATHTEYTRLLAEHGLFGAAAMLVLLLICVQRALHKQPRMEKAIIISLTIWALLTMAHAATRMAAPSILFGLASARFLFEE